jgi:hypothetical protein
MMVEYWTEAQAKEELEAAMKEFLVQADLDPLSTAVGSHDPYGMPYRRFVQGLEVAVAEGEPVQRGYTWLGPEMLKDFMKNLRKSLRKARFVSWRVFPEVRAITLGTTSIYFVYCRFTAYDSYPHC